jgi:hypothetical protein
MSETDNQSDADEREGRSAESEREHPTALPRPLRPFGLKVRKRRDASG